MGIAYQLFRLNGFGEPVLTTTTRLVEHGRTWVVEFTRPEKEGDRWTTIFASYNKAEAEHAYYKRILADLEFVSYPQSEGFLVGVRL